MMNRNIYTWCKDILESKDMKSKSTEPRSQAESWDNYVNILDYFLQYSTL